MAGLHHGGADPSVLDANYLPQLTVGRRPPGAGVLGGARRGIGGGAFAGGGGGRPGGLAGWQG